MSNDGPPRSFVCGHRRANRESTRESINPTRNHCTMASVKIAGHDGNLMKLAACVSHSGIMRLEANHARQKICIYARSARTLRAWWRQARYQQARYAVLHSSRSGVDTSRRHICALPVALSIDDTAGAMRELPSGIGTGPDALRSRAYLPGRRRLLPTSSARRSTALEADSFLYFYRDQSARTTWGGAIVAA